MSDTHLWQRLKPGVSRRATVFIAAIVWGIASFNVLRVGVRLLLEPAGSPWWRVAAGLAGFPVFFGLVFLRVTRKHTRRMVSVKNERPCAFAFFDWRGYGVMAFMIAMGLTVRLLHLVPAAWLGPFYLSLGLSLLASALLFARGGWRFEAVRRDLQQSR